MTQPGFLLLLLFCSCHTLVRFVCGSSIPIVNSGGRSITVSQLAQALQNQRVKGTINIMDCSKDHCLNNIVNAIFATDFKLSEGNIYL